MKNIKLLNKRKVNLTQHGEVSIHRILITIGLKRMLETKQEIWNTSSYPEVMKIKTNGLNSQTAQEHQEKFLFKKIMNLDTHHSMPPGRLAKQDQQPFEMVKVCDNIFQNFR
jgi:hypothetical protein